MPILEINILGFKTEIDYQQDEKEKLLNLVKQFKSRLSKYEDLKGRFADNKIIILAALKTEDDILELNRTIESQKKIIQEKKDLKESNDSQLKEIIELKDELSLLKIKNQKLESEKKLNTEKFEKLNNKIITIIDRIANNNIYEDK